MRYLGLGVGLLLAACNSGSNDAPSPVASATSPSSPESQPAASTALLDQLTSPQQKGRYAPRDECGKQPGATAFRRKLAEAVASGNADGIAALASPSVKLGFGGDDGQARLLEKLKEPNGKLMDELKRLLPLGCAVDAGGNLTIPWSFAQDMGDVDSYTAMLVTGEDVPLHITPNAESSVKAQLSWDLVQLAGGLRPDRPFQEVRTADGQQQGYMPTDKLRSLLDTRLLASRENGEWRITAILAGD